MFSQANPRRDSLPRTGYRRGSYLTTHRQVRYFRITVPHHLQSLLGKKEIRRSLDGLDSRMARSKAMRLSVIAQTFFAFLDDVQDGRIRFAHGDTSQYTENIRKIAHNLDTFWFDAAMRENLSPAALVLRLPSFLKDTGWETEDTSPPEQKKWGIETPDVSASRAQFEGIKRSDHLYSSALQTEIRIRQKRPFAPREEAVARKVKSALPSLDEAAESYITAKKLTWSKASAKDIPPQIRQFVQIVDELENGRTLPIDKLSREHIRGYYDTLRHLPFRVKGQSAYRDKKKSVR